MYIWTTSDHLAQTNNYSQVEIRKQTQEQTKVSMMHHLYCKRIHRRRISSPMSKYVVEVGRATKKRLHPSPSFYASQKTPMPQAPLMNSPKAKREIIDMLLDAVFLALCELISSIELTDWK